MHLLSLLLSLSTTEKSLAPSSLLLPSYLYTWIKTSEPSLLHNSSPSSLSSHRKGSVLLIINSFNDSSNHLYGLLLDSLQYVHIYVGLRSSALDPALQMYLTSAEQKGTTTSLDLLAPSGPTLSLLFLLLLMCPQKPFLLPFMFIVIQFQIYFGFVNPPLHAWTVSLYSYNKYLPCIATTRVYSKIPFKEAKNRTSCFNFSF